MITDSKPQHPETSERGCNARHRLGKELSFSSMAIRVPCCSANNPQTAFCRASSEAITMSGRHGGVRGRSLLGVVGRTSMRFVPAKCHCPAGRTSAPSHSLPAHLSGVRHSPTKSAVCCTNPCATGGSGPISNAAQKEKAIPAYVGLTRASTA